MKTLLEKLKESNVEKVIEFKFYSTKFDDYIHLYYKANKAFAFSIIEELYGRLDEVYIKLGATQIKNNMDLFYKILFMDQECKENLTPDQFELLMLDQDIRTQFYITISSLAISIYNDVDLIFNKDGFITFNEANKMVENTIKVNENLFANHGKLKKKSNH